MNYQEDFKTYFGTDLNPYWDNLFGFNICKFDTEFIKTPSNETMEEAIIRMYGYSARNFVINLLKIMPVAGRV